MDYLPHDMFTSMDCICCKKQHLIGPEDDKFYRFYLSMNDEIYLQCPYKNLLLKNF